MSIKTISETLRTARLAKKSRNPSRWTRAAVAERAASLGAQLYGEKAPEVEAEWLRWRENAGVNLCETDIRRIELVARVLELDPRQLFLLILR